jgi:hypothetical protein
MLVTPLSIVALVRLEQPLNWPSKLVTLLGIVAVVRPRQ